MRFFELFFVTLQPKGCETAPARQLMHCNATLCTFRSEKHHCSRSTAVLAPEFSLKYVFIMARPIKETPILYGEDARRFEARMKERRRISAEERSRINADYELVLGMLKRGEELKQQRHAATV